MLGELHQSTLPILHTSLLPGATSTTALSLPLPGPHSCDRFEDLGKWRGWNVPLPYGITVQLCSGTGQQIEAIEMQQSKTDSC